MSHWRKQEKERWEQIKTIFNKNNKFAGIDQSNQVGQVISQLAEFNDNLEGIQKAIKGEGSKAKGEGK